MEYLPNDKEADRDRYFLSTKHQQAFNNGLSYYWDVKSASDDKYPDDFSSPQNRDLQRLLLREGGFKQKLGVWNATPVSYTHLDVYKRQVLASMDRDAF